MNSVSVGDRGRSPAQDVSEATNAKLFTALEFLIKLLQHLPDPRAYLMHRYGLYSSRGR